MKKNLLLFFVVFMTTGILAQNVAINNNSAIADPSSMLDISSTTKGMLIPRMRSNERQAISNPANGLMVYDVDTRSFWYYDITTWREVLNSNSTLSPTGFALGDLYGTYPAPSVGKIQNLDVALGVPFDKQILKWDMLNNRWQGMNDSLFLPYNVTYGDPSKLFAITNTNNTNGATAIYGKNGTGSGMTPATTVGVWGDNANGAGLVGTSMNGTAMYGFSQNSYGVYGYTAGINVSGVYGSNANAGVGILGEVYNGGIGISGKANGIQGKSAFFRTINPGNLDTAVVIQHEGLGRGLYIGLNNTSNTVEALNINSSGSGQTVNINNSNNSNAATMINADHYGTGYGMFIYSHNTLNPSATLGLQNLGPGSGIESFAYKGKAGYFRIPSVVNTSDALEASTLGTGSAATFSIINAANNNAAVEVTTNGTGRGLQVSLSNAANLTAAIHASSSGNKGIEGFGQQNGIIGQSTGLTGGIGILGQSHLNSSTGIGVKGISYGIGNTFGAVTGVNNADGVGVHGSSTGAGGIGVFGETSTGTIGVYGKTSATDAIGVYGIASGTDGIALYADAGQYGSLSHAAFFRNANSNNNRTVVQLENWGTGNDLFITNLNASNGTSMILLRNSGTGKFFRLEDGSNSEVFSVAKSGNLVTDGTITVKSDKGIIRNSSSTQLRTEILTATFSGAAGTFSQLESRTIDISFGATFGSTPSVFLGNVVTNGSGNADKLHAAIKNVTTSGCQLYIQNQTGGDMTVSTSSWKIVAIGAE